MNKFVPTVLEGAHVRLEPLSSRHVRGLAAIGIDDDIWRHMPYGEIKDEADMLRWVDALLALEAQGADIPFVVVHTASGRIAGATRFMDVRPEHRGVEIGGTWYGVDFRRTVVNTE
jgi:RimJ/RimL family protein N-acetyltransferase